MKKALFEKFGLTDESIEKLKDQSKNAWAVGVTAASDLSQQVASTDLFQSLNNFKSEVSKAMDAEFLKKSVGALDQETQQLFSPSNHRILDGGHTFFESIERAKQVGEQNSWTEIEVFSEWAKAYFTDLSSTAGMPMFGKLTDNVYDLLRELKIDEATARDIVTLNGQEAVEAILSGTIAAAGLFFAWKNEDKDNFSKTIGALLVSGAISMNPVTLSIVIFAMAMGYNSLVCKKAIARGGIIAGATLTVSALIPGPVILGFVPAMVVAIYLNKKLGKDFDAIDFGKRAYFYVKSEKFKAQIDSVMNNLESFKTKLSKPA